MNVITERYSLYEGDCLEVMKGFAPASFHAIIVDLPYEQTNCTWDSMIPLQPLWEQFKRLVKPNGAIVLFGSQPFTSLLVCSNLEWFKHSWVWSKGNCGNFANAQRAPLKFHEDILIFAVAQHTYNPQFIWAGIPGKNRGSSPRNLGMGNKLNYAKDFTYKPDELLRYPNTILNFSSGADECNNTVRLHPTQKPVDLLAYLIKTYTNPGETILDCTMGSGTTIAAALETGRKGVGIELDSNYFQVAAKRCADAHRAAQGLPKELRGKASDLADMPLFMNAGD